MMQINISQARPPYTFRLLLQRFSTRLARAVAACVVLGLVLAVISRPVQAQNPGPQAAAQQLTQSLVALNARLQRADATDRPQLLDKLLELAAERWVMLTALIEDNPGALLQVALPTQVRDSLPPMAQTYIEEHVQIEGRLEIFHEDRDMDSRYLHFLEVNGERLPMHFSTRPPTHLLTDTKIRVVGVKLGDDLALVSGEDSIETLALNNGKGNGNNSDGSSGTNTDTTSNLPNTFGEQRTVVFLVNFQDKPTEQPWTLDDAWNVVFGTTSDFFLENSYQQTWLSGDVYGWYTIPLDSTVCDTSSIASYAQQAATAAGVDLSVYTRYIYAFPGNACNWWGLSSVGGKPSQAWINGNPVVRVVSHELGHGFGLWHSHSLDCGTATLGTDCTTVEYGDVVDTMGGPIGFLSAAHLNAFQKERLGWLNAGASPPLTTVVSDGTYTLETYESAGSGPKALKIPKSTDPTTGKRTWYYVESRQPIGFDAFLATNSSIASNTNVSDGVLLHMGTDSSGNTSHLLDLRPDTSNWWDPALAVGESFEDPDAGVTVTTDWVTETEAAVTVHFGPGTVTAANVTVSTDQASYTRPRNVIVMAEVRDEGSPVANIAVSFTVTKSNGTVVTGNATTGSDGTAMYKIRLKKQDPAGSYQAGVVADVTGLSGSADTTFTVK